MKRILISAAVAAAMFSGAAAAQGYVGVAVGQSKIDIDCSGTLACDDSDTGYKLFGGFLFTPNFGVEAAYYNHGKATFSVSDPELGTVAGEFKGNGFGLFGIAVAPFDKFSVFGKVGVASYKVKLRGSVGDLSGSTSERNTGLAWGVGAGYDFTKNVGLRVEFERVRAEFMDEKENVDLLSVGVRYRF